MMRVLRLCVNAQVIHSCARGWMLDTGYWILDSAACCHGELVEPCS